METQSKILKEKRVGLLNEMETLTQKLKAEHRKAFTEQEHTQYDGLDRQQEQLLAEIETTEKCERLAGLHTKEGRENFKAGAVNENLRPEKWRNAEDRNNAFKGWATFGTKAAKPEYWRAAERCGMNVQSPHYWWDLPEDWSTRNNQRRTEQRLDPTIDTYGNANFAGDFAPLADNRFMGEVIDALKLYGGVREVCTVVRTPNFVPLPLPTADVTGEVGVIGAEADGSTAIADLATRVGRTTLGGFRFDSGIAKFSWELELNSAIDIAARVGKVLGSRLGRAQAPKFTTGTGSGEPQGIVTGSVLGASAASSTTATTLADINKLYHSVDPLYRKSPKCGYMFNDDQANSLDNLTDGNGRPLLESSLAGIKEIGSAGEGTLKRKPVQINQSMASPGASAKVMLFGDFDYYWIRDVAGEQGGITTRILRERYVELGLVGMLAWMWSDAAMVNPSLTTAQAPVKYFQLHA